LQVVLKESKISAGEYSDRGILSKFFDQP